MATDNQDEAAVNIETLWAVHSGVQQHVRLADTKAGFIAGLNTLMVGFLAPQLDGLIEAASEPTLVACIASVMLVAYGLSTAASFGLVLAAVISRLGERAPRCRIFFGHIAASYGRDYARYHDEICKLSDAEWAKDISSQIVENAHIASTKHRLIAFAAYTTAFALVFWGGTVLALAFI